jgi:hypothetical protein
MKKPRTSAHQTSQAMSTAFQSPSPIVPITQPTIPHLGIS